LFGGIYHGFFTQQDPVGRVLWILTLAAIGGAATMSWMLSAVLTRTAMRKAAWLSGLLFIGYLAYVVFADRRFVVSIVFALPPLLVLLVIFVRRARSWSALQGASAILLMLLASVLQQLHVGIHPVYFNHNALYHLLQGAALALLFVALKRMEVRESQHSAVLRS